MTLLATQNSCSILRIMYIQNVSDKLVMNLNSAPPAPPPPPEHPPPPPPITQVMKLDNKSDYAKVFSSAATTPDQNGQQHAPSIPAEGTTQGGNIESVICFWPRKQFMRGLTAT